MATTQPTPQPPNPTTDSEETPPTTNQQTLEAVDPLTTNDSPATDSEGIGTELRVTVPTTSETATDLPAILRPSEPTDIGLTIGPATAGVVVVMLTLTVVIIIAVLLKKHRKTKKKEGYSVKNHLNVAAVPTTTNQAYGLTHHSKSGVEENIYNFPEVNVDTIEAKQNEAYVTYTDIITEGNQAYGTNIATEINSAYGPVETADEYDYI